MKLRTRLRSHNLPMPNDVVEDLGGGGPPPPPPPAPWYSTDPDWAEASKDPEFKGWVEKVNPKGGVALLKTQRELEGKLGSSLQPWKEGEDPTKWQGWGKLGAYEKPEDYAKAIKRPTMPDGVVYDEAAEKAALDIAAKVRAPAHVVQAYLDMAASQRLADIEKTRAFETGERQKLDKLYDEWGVPKGGDGKYQTVNHPKIIDAQRAMKALGMDGDLVEALDGFAGGDKIMKFLAAVGQHPAVKEGRMVTGDVNANTTKETALARIKALDDKYQKEGLTKEEKAERSQMFAIAYPNGQAA